MRQLKLAMERGRWLPPLSDRPTVFVNVPIFRLWASDPVRGEEPLRMNVVVGKSMSHNTPIFIEEMEYVVFRPYWNPPYGIVTREITVHVNSENVVHFVGDIYGHDRILDEALERGYPYPEAE